MPQLIELKDCQQDKFPLGRVVITTYSHAKLNPEDVRQALQRHARGDWGEVNKHDQRLNEKNLAHHALLWSAYTTSDGTEFFIITASDRSTTVIQLPADLEAPTPK